MLLNRFIVKPKTILGGLLLLQITPWQPVIAQPIIPAPDGTQTQVILTEPGQFQIQGGTESGGNLFHSFEQFGLDSGQRANFISTPNIENILGRVTGGNPSYINGLIQVSGSSANLFLMNPAGMIFGENARLNVPADFTATTADGIGFGSSGWFNAIGENNELTLVGTPNGFRFDRSVSGTLINLGQLQVNSGQNLGLIGGQVISTGTLSAPNGRLWVQTVPGESLIRMSQAGQLLSLDLPQSILNSDQQSNLELNPLILPELLTGGSASAQTVTTNTQGELVLQGNQPIQPGDIVITSGNGFSALQGETVLFNAAQTLTVADIPLNVSGNLNLSAGDTVRIRDSLGQNSGLQGFSAIVGGNLTILGQQSIDILALNTPDQAFHIGGDLTFISDGIISADSHFHTGGHFRLLNTQGGFGTFISLFDPIIRSSGDVVFGNYTGASLKVEAGGAIFGGNISITQPDTTLTNTTDPDAELLRSRPTLILRSGVTGLETDTLEGDGFFNGPITGNDISVGTIETNGGPVILESAGAINLDTITTASGEIIATGTDNIVVVGTIASGGGNIDLTTDSTIQVRGNFNDINGVNASISSAGPNGEGGQITILHSGNQIPFIIGDSALNGTAASITTGSSNLNSVRSVDGSLTQGNIAINPSDSPTPPTPLEPTPTPSEPTPTPLEPTPTPTPLEPTPTPLEPTPSLPQPTPIPIIPPFPLEDPPEDPLADPLTPTDSLIPELDLDSQENNNLLTALEATDQPRRDLAITRGESPLNQSVNIPSFNSSGLLSIESTTEQPVISNTNSSQPPLTPQLDDNGAITLAEVEPNLETVETNVEIEDAGGNEVDTSEVTALELARDEVSNSIDSEQVDQSIIEIDQFFDSEYTSYLGTKKDKGDESRLSVTDMQSTLSKMSQQLDSRGGIVYTFIRDDQLDILLITADGTKIHKTVPEANKAQLMQVMTQLREQIFRSRYRQTPLYLPAAQQLYQWIIKPIEPELEQQEINTLLFAMDAGIRSVPLGMLHDGKQFLIEKYNFSLIPSFNLINTRYRPLKNARVLAMGASIFQNQQPLPAVPIEIQAITSTLAGDAFLNEAFTLNNFEQQRDKRPYQIIHLATHGEFRPGEPNKSYIQFWDSRLTMNNLRQLDWRWNNPPLDLLVLSACRSALGDKEAELGFAGLAVQAGIPTALASLWYVSDQGALALMTEFYNQLQTAPSKAEALRRAQIAMLRGEVQVQSGQLRNQSNQQSGIVLPPELARQYDKDFSNPYYWAGWTVIGSPW